MAKLTEDEAAKLAELQAKAEAPDEEEPKGNGTTRTLNIGIDLGDEAQIERAISLGLLSRPEAEELQGGEGGEGGEEEGPKRRGFFPES